MDNSKYTSTHDKIELRSEKVRNILSEVPNGLVRWGIAVICIFFVMLITAISFIQFPYGKNETIFEYMFFHD